MTRRIVCILIAAFSLASCNFPVRVNVAEVFTSPTPTFTSEPSLTPTATPTPTPTITPSPQPAARVEQAENSLWIGAYEQARRQFQEAMNASRDPELQAAAALGMGRTLYQQNNIPAAVNALESFITNYPQHNERAVAYYYLGLCFTANQNHVKAAEAYQKYLDLRPGVLDTYIQELRGNAFRAAGLPASAIEAYAAAVKAGGDQNTIWIEMKLGQAYAQNGDFSKAISQFIAIYEKSDNEYAKAQANYLLGQTYLTMGMPEQAYARFQDSITNYPRAYDSYSGLVALVNAGVEVNELNRGIVDYYAGEYGLAVEALTRYLNSGAQQNGTANHFRALSWRAINEHEKAIRDWDTVIDQYPGSRYWATAWDEKAYTLWGWLDAHEDAAAVLLTFIEKNPTAPEAPDFLFYAARILERNKQFTQAAATWERMMNEYPSAARSYRGLFLAGVTYYRAQDYPKALLIFQRALVLTSQPGDQAAAFLWIGKVHQTLGDTAAMQQAWEQGAQRDPTGYYSERANELLQGRAAVSPTRPFDLGYDLNSERPQGRRLAAHHLFYAARCEPGWFGRAGKRCVCAARQCL
jgi:soluble lytic murein transglycosylase